MKHYRIRPFSSWGKKTRSAECDESASKPCLQYRVYNTKTQLIDTYNPLSGGLRKTSAQYYRATIESLSSPILKAATTNCEKCIFSSFFLLSVLPLHYENETQGQFQRT